MSEMAERVEEEGRWTGKGGLVADKGGGEYMLTSARDTMCTVALCVHRDGVHPRRLDLLAPLVDFFRQMVK